MGNKNLKLKEKSLDDFLKDDSSLRQEVTYDEFLSKDASLGDADHKIEDAYKKYCKILRF